MAATAAGMLKCVGVAWGTLPQQLAHHSEVQTTYCMSRAAGKTTCIVFCVRGRV
jgi:hypothetical protein